MKVEEMVQTAKNAHDDLTREFYSGKSGMPREVFEVAHEKIWKDLEEDLKTAEDYIAPEPLTP
jgi:hypothetical protein